MKPKDRATYDNTLKTDTILHILQSLQENPIAKFPETRQFRRIKQLKFELSRRGIKTP